MSISINEHKCIFLVLAAWLLIMTLMSGWERETEGGNLDC